MNKQLGNKVYQQLKCDIRNHDLPVGVPLKQQALSDKYAVSRIPIRDALQQLKAEGWLVSVGKRGLMIPPLCADEAEDLYRIRVEVEPMILPYVIESMTNQVLGEAEDFLNIIDSNQSLGVLEHGELNWQFHAVLYKVAKRPTLFNTISSLHQQCERYIGFHTRNLGYKVQSQEEHYHLLTAIRNRNLRESQAILKAHIGKAGEQLTDYLKNNP